MGQKISKPRDPQAATLADACIIPEFRDTLDSQSLRAMSITCRVIRDILDGGRTWRVAFSKRLQVAEQTMPPEPPQPLGLMATGMRFPPYFKTMDRALALVEHDCEHPAQRRTTQFDQLLYFQLGQYLENRYPEVWQGHISQSLTTAVTRENNHHGRVMAANSVFKEVAHYAGAGVSAAFSGASISSAIVTTVETASLGSALPIIGNVVLCIILIRRSYKLGNAAVGLVDRALEVGAIRREAKAVHSDFMREHNFQKRLSTYRAAQAQNPQGLAHVQQQNPQGVVANVQQG